MKRSAKKEAKYVTETTFEKHMRSITKSFISQSQVLEMILKELKALHEDTKYNKDTLSSFVGDVSVHNRKINNLTMRVEKLEMK